MPEEKKEKQTPGEYCLDQIKKLSNDVSNFRKECAEALLYFNGDPSIVKSPKKRSQATTTDFRDAVEWMRPSLLDIFTSNYEIAKIGPAGGEDDKNAKLVDKLVNYQVKIKNKWYEIMSDFISDTLMYRVGVIKYQWFTEIRKVKKQYSLLNQVEVEAIKKNPNIEVIEEEYLQPGLANLTVILSIKDSYPLIECIPLEEIGFRINIKKTENAFIWHRISYSKFEVIQRYGKEKFKKIEKDRELLEDGSEEFKQGLFKDIDDSFFFDENEDKYNIYECYYRDEETGVHTITELCGSVELNTYESKYDSGPPFIIASAMKKSHRLVGSSQFEMNKEYQKIRTAILRQILDNLYFCNNRRYFVDPLKVDMKDYLTKNNPGAAIKTKGGARPSDCAWPEEKAPIPPEVFAFWERILVEKDYHTGVPRSFQGVNNDELNKTFRGQAQQIQQASQRVAEAARTIAETAVAPLIEKIIELNIKFLDKEISFRYLNEPIKVNPDNIVGKYDITVKVGIGTGEKDKIVMQMEQLLSLFAQATKVGVPVVNAQDVYNVFKDLIQNMGHKNFNDYITDPKVNMMVMELIKLVLSLGIHQQMPQTQPLIQQLMAAFGMNINPKDLGTEGVNPPQGSQPQNPSLPMQGDYFG